VSSLSLPAGATFLVPAYHHGSEIEALVRAGVSLGFYDVWPDLSPDEGSLDAALDDSVAGLYLIHPIGIAQDAGRWRAWADERGLLLIEDAAQSWMASSGGEPAGALGDLSIFCLYKSFGVPDGAALVGPAVEAPVVGPIGAGATLLRAGAWAASRSRAVATVAAARTRRRASRGGHDTERAGELVADMELDPAPAAPSRLSRWLLPRAFEADAPARRRANYETLLEGLGELVPEPMRSVPAGAAPWVFPIAVTEDKEGAFLRLRNLRIDAVHLWKLPHPLLDASAFPVAARLRDTLIGLPVHHELRDEDLDRIARATKEALARA
jgi:dTDP-4-amino-4,6-dideoxygalactose transaminase